MNADVRGSEYISFIRKLCIKLNDRAVQLLQRKETQLAALIFEKSRVVLEVYGQPEHSRSLSLVLNHLGCCYRSVGKYKKASLCLEKAIGLAEANKGLSLLNLCAVNS